MDGTCVVRDPKGQQIACIARLPSGLYQVQRNVKSAHAKQVMSLDEFHRRMGHLRMDATKVLVQKGMIMGIELDDSPSDSNCASCVEAKMTHVPFPKQHSSPRATTYGQLVHSDLCSPLPSPTITGKQYIALFLDDYSTELKVTLLTHKSEVMGEYVAYEAWVLNHRGAKLVKFHTDPGGKFTSNELKQHLMQQGTEHPMTVHDSPQQNGAPEQ